MTETTAPERPPLPRRTAVGAGVTGGIAALGLLAAVGLILLCNVVPGVALILAPLAVLMAAVGLALLIISRRITVRARKGLEP